MITNLNEYFLPEYQFYLHEIEFKRLDTDKNASTGASNVVLNCNDKIIAAIHDEGDSVDLIVSRTLSFDPSIFFVATVSFGAVLTFSPAKKDEYDWSTIDLAEEMAVNGQFVTTNLIARITLLLGEITSSFGQTPLLTPPQFISRQSE